MRRRYRRADRAFTLIEVTLGLAILVLIFGVIFQLVQMSVLGADAAAKNSLRSREISGLFALVRQLCLDLTVRSTVTLVPRPGAAGFDLELANAPLLILPNRQDGVRIIRLALEKDPVGGGGNLVLQEIFQATNNPAIQTFPPETNTFLLMREVSSIRWLAGDPRNLEEQREWNEPIKPAYLRLELVRRDAGRNLTNTGIFWIPTGYSPSGQPPVDPVTRSLVAANVAPGVTPVGDTPGGTSSSLGTPGQGVGQGGARGGPAVGGTPGGGNSGPAVRYTPIRR